MTLLFSLVQAVACAEAGAQLISPFVSRILEELQGMNVDVPLKLDADAAKTAAIEKIDITEASFRWLLNEDAMGTEKLAQGIRVFGQDMLKVRAIVEAKLG